MDNRKKNTYFTSSSLPEYVRAYAVTLSHALSSVESAQLDSAVRCLRDARRIFICGNGGSAAIANHWACDHSLGLRDSASLREVHSLASNAAVLTAAANDFGLEQCFAAQLKSLRLDWADVVVCISASGSSPNVTAAADLALERNAHVVALTGFDGGLLRGRASHALHIDARNYGIIEDAHSALMHCLAQYLYVTDQMLSNAVDACGAV